MKIERTKAGEQFYFGNIEALQTKRIIKDKGSAQLPLFEQQPEPDKNQINIFAAAEAKHKAEIYKVDKSLEPEKIGTIAAESIEQLKQAFINFIDKILGKADYLIKSDVSKIGIYAKKKESNYYIKYKESR